MIAFDELQQNIKNLDTIEGVDLFIVGYSLLNRPIYGVHLGSYDGPQMIMEGGTHAREYMSTLYLIEEIKYLAEKTFLLGGTYIIPLVNPDGVGLVLEGLNTLTCQQTKDYILLVNNGSEDFSQWKANANAVDINVNYPALWGQGAQNVFCPSSGNFVGYYPASEREVNEMMSFTNQISPAITLSWHTKGEIIYYGFETLTEEQLARDYDIATKLSAVNGYEIVKTENSVAGYSDWVSLNFGVPAYTIEVGSATLPHPIAEEYLLEIFEQNKDVPIVALEQVGGIFAETVQVNKKQVKIKFVKNNRRYIK